MFESEPDGYTVMAHSPSHIANAYMYKKLPYDTLNDFIDVTALAKQVDCWSFTSRCQ
jgi:tripartite-type tricarboxylate transporter receptor subunit TctC